jgi:Kdo2-lipid IVA lauroyltransferase/acyltransferase
LPAKDIRLSKQNFMSKIQSTRYMLGFYLFFGLSWPLLKLPLKVLYFFSDLVYIIFFYFPGYRREVVINNMRNAFPGKSESEIRDMAKGFYKHLCDSFVESFAAINMSEEEIRKRCVWKNLELLDHHYQNGKSVVSVFGHYGNWEWMSTLPLHTKYKVLALYKPLSNIYFDRFIKLVRQKHGIQTVPVIRSFPVILDYHKTNVQTLTFFLGDQRPVKSHIRYWTSFLNQDTPVMLGSEQIAKRLGQAVVYFSMNKIRRGYYEVEILPVTDDPEQTAMYEITEKHTRLLEAQIENQPEYWLWSHKRWKHKMESC